MYRVFRLPANQASRADILWKDDLVSRQSVTGRDYPVIMGTVLLMAIVISVVNLLVDISYAFLDPRIRLK